MTLPPLDLKLSTSTTATGQATAGFDNSGFVVQFGNGNSAASAKGADPLTGAASVVPSWAWMAVAVLVAVKLFRG